ncbi:MAG: class I poly(R)-hydroxyalkanoic acid synthase [Hyphomicrobium sp.]|nr:class I poly(R)-hydroxyalkanoic acid synthase [Hyphomicrobium sp.]
MNKHAAKPEEHPTYRIADPEEFTRNVLKAYEDGGRAIAQMLERSDTSANSAFSTASELTRAMDTWGEITSRWMSDPTSFATAQAELVTQYAELYNRTFLKMMGETQEPVIEPAPTDNRFRDPEWSNNPYFDFIKQAYLLTTKWAEDNLARTELEAAERHKAEFYLRQLSSAFSPSNFPMTNPEVVREMCQTNARNLVEGMHQLLGDMERSGDLMRITQTDATAFEVGKNLATTPGKVVFQNELLQLIQYSPSTDKVREIPILVTPPWINKYYVLDLTPQKSLMKWIVDQGYTVFVISWVNPDASMANRTFEDYMLEGLLAAADAVCRETKVPQCNVLGYCVGGTMVGTTLAWLAARGETPFKSVTFLTTQVDFSRAGDLLLFTEDEQLANLEEVMKERGYLDGSRMANVFNMMRPRDLIWPYVVNNYLLGRKPFPFDLLYWNQDSTRIAAACHAFYLREYYNENKLAKGQMKFGGVKLDLGKIALPIFHLATRDDHIAPAESVYIGARMMKGPIEFVLAGSGHIAGVINPPDKIKYQYWTNPDLSPPHLAQWIEKAEEHPGSWWPYWNEWLARQSGEWTLPREPGETIGVIEDAPGSYVKVMN